MTDVIRPSVCCMNSSDVCNQYGPCSYLLEQFAANWAVHVPSADDASLTMHESLRLSGAMRERKLIVDWLHNVKKSAFADMIRRGEHLRCLDESD